MKFTIYAKVLKEMIEKAATTIDKKSVLESLKRLYMQIDENETLRIWSSDLNHYVEIRNNSVYLTSPGIVGIDIDDIKIITKMTGEVTIEDVSTENERKINIICGKKTVSIPGYGNTDIFLPDMDDTEMKILNVKENLLHSGNKEHIDKLNIVFDNALKELLQCRRKALQFLACCYGYDFQKPFKVTGLLGKFTVNSIKKMTGSNNGILLVCKGTEVLCVELNTGKFEIKIPRDKYKYSIDDYYVKYDFEEDRKSGKLGVFIIQQDAKYKREVKRTSNSYYCYNNRNSDEFDKSGCNITEARQALKYRLHNYKADRRKREVDSISYEADLKEIKEMFQTLKEKLIVKLSEAKTSEDYKNIENIFDYRFTWMVRNIENFETKVTQNNFRNIEEASYSIKSLKEQIEVKIKKIDGKEEVD